MPLKNSLTDGCVIFKTGILLENKDPRQIFVTVKFGFRQKQDFFKTKIRNMKNYRFSGKQIISFPGPPNSRTRTQTHTLPV